MLDPLGGLGRLAPGQGCAYNSRAFPLGSEKRASLARPKEAAGAGVGDDPGVEDAVVVRRIVGTQLAALGLAALGVWSLQLGSERQALIGGLVALAPNFWMARRVQRAGKNPRPPVAAGGLFGAMIIKLLIAVGLLALALRQLPEEEGVAFFIGFIAVHLAHRVGAVLKPA